MLSDNEKAQRYPQVRSAVMVQHAWWSAGRKQALFSSGSGLPGSANPRHALTVMAHPIRRGTSHFCSYENGLAARTQITAAVLYKVTGMADSQHLVACQLAVMPSSTMCLTAQGRAWCACTRNQVDTLSLHPQPSTHATMRTPKMRQWQSITSRSPLEPSAWHIRIDD